MPDSAEPIQNVVVVTPARNSERFLDETIMSVATLAGDFDLYYHVQDSGSTDGTLEILKTWEARLAAHDTLFRPGKIYFSWVSESDASMYDGLNKGFARVLAAADENAARQTVMTWINSDDKLASNSAQTVVDFLSAKPQFDWVTGRACLLSENGSIARLRTQNAGFSRMFLSKGKHDGRTSNFVMQEGTFWRRSLWEKSGGLNAKLKLVGDWDLWRRFAEHAPLVTLEAALAYHRRHANQLSVDMDRYWNEADSVLVDLQKNASEISLQKRLTNWMEQCVGYKANYDLQALKWVVMPARVEMPRWTFSDVRWKCFFLRNKLREFFRKD